VPVTNKSGGQNEPATLKLACRSSVSAMSSR